MISFGISIVALLIAVAAYLKARIAERAFDEMFKAMTQSGPEPVQRDPLKTL